MKQLLFSLSLLLFLHFHCTITLAQSPTAAPPGPSGPPNITKILEKAGQFTVFLRLMRTTQVADRITIQLNNSNQGMTVFAPPDNAFSSLQSGTLNSLTDQQKAELIQFHTIPSFLSTSQFQTVSNPVTTQAGNSQSGQFPLNVTTSGGNNVNISTGVVNASVVNTIYTDSQLAVYQVDKVLLPAKIFGPPSPAAAPAPATSKKKKSPAADSPSSSNPADASGGGVSLSMHGMVGSIVVAVIIGSFLL